MAPEMCVSVRKSEWGMYGGYVYAFWKKKEEKDFAGTRTQDSMHALPAHYPIELHRPTAVPIVTMESRSCTK